jgi:hypothetical protein
MRTGTRIRYSHLVASIAFILPSEAIVLSSASASRPLAFVQSLWPASVTHRF